MTDEKFPDRDKRAQRHEETMAMLAAEHAAVQRLESAYLDLALAARRAHREMLERRPDYQAGLTDAA